MANSIADRVASLKRITESFSTTADRVDREAGVIYGVRCLGSESRNGRRYSDKALDSATQLYEGMTVYVDHRKGDGSPNRGLLEEVGVLKSSRKSDGAVYADLHYLKSHAASEQIIERIERGMPLGMSHDAEGPVNRDGSETIVEDITHVFSVDIVRNPATNSTLFESVQQEAKPMARKIKKVLEQHSKRIPAAKRLLEMDGDPMEMDMAYEPVAEEPSPEEDVNAAIASLVMAILAEELTIDEKLAKIEGVLRSAANEPAPADAPASDPGDNPPAEDAVTEEVKQLRQQLARFDRNEAIREACEEIGVSVADLGKDRLELVRSASDNKSARKLIESWAPSLKPRSKPQGVASRRLVEENTYESSRRRW